MRQAIVPTALAQAARDTGFSPAIRAGDFLYLTGATGGEADGTMPESIRKQTEILLHKASLILAADGANEADIVEMTSYHTDITRDFDDIQAVVTDHFTAPLPAWTAVEVAQLRRDEARVEFRFVAYHPTQRSV